MSIRNLVWVCIAATLLIVAGSVTAAPTKIGVLNDSSLPKIGAPSDPAYLAELLTNAGYEPVMLSASDLADPKLLDPKSMPVVVLPYGPIFPAEAASNWKGYLRSGGSFFTTGGYAFDEAVWKKDGKWQTWAEMAAREPK